MHVLNSTAFYTQIIESQFKILALIISSYHFFSLQSHKKKIINFFHIYGIDDKWWYMNDNYSINIYYL